MHMQCGHGRLRSRPVFIVKVKIYVNVSKNVELNAGDTNFLLIFASDISIKFKLK